MFVLLDRRAPSPPGFPALPPGVEAQRVGLAEAAARTRDFLQEGEGLISGTASLRVPPGDREQ